MPAPFGRIDIDTVDETGATSGNVLDNDIDLDGDTLTVTQVNGSTGDVGSQITLASGAMVTLNADGTYDYDPNGAFSALDDGEQAIDQFFYTVSDGNGGVDTVIVRIKVNGEDNAAPTALGETACTDEDDGAIVLDVLGNDSDPDSDALTVTEIAGSGAATVTLGSGATVSVNSDGTLDYDPTGAWEGLDAGETATETFTYTISDGQGGQDSASVTVTIKGEDDLPVANGDTAHVDEDDGDSVVVNVLDNDSDPDDPLEVVGFSSGSVDATNSSPQGAIVELQSDGDLSYDPNGQFESLGVGESATDSFTYTVSDGEGNTDSASIVVTIWGENDAPVANADSICVDENADLGTVIGNVLGNDSDIDGGPLFVSEPFFTDDPDSDDILISVDSDGDIYYFDDGAFDSLGDGDTASDSFVYQISDGNGGTDTATVFLTIKGENDAPIAAADTAMAFEDDGAAVVVNVLANDSDVDAGDSLTVTPDSFTFGSGATASVGSDGDFSFNPNGGYESLGVGETATETVTYTVSDGEGGTDTASVTVTIKGENDAPFASGETACVDENGPAATGDVLANDADTDVKDDLSVSAVAGDTSSVGEEITLSSGARVDVAQDGTYIYNPSGSDFESLTDGESATDSFTYTVSDGEGGTDSATVVITVKGENDAPVAAADTACVDEDDGLALVVNVLDNDSDPDASDDPFVSGFSGGAVGATITTPQGAFLELQSDGDLSYDPNGQFESLAVGETATESFTYTISDGNGATDSATVTVTVKGENDGPPVANDDTGGTLESGLAAGNVLDNDTDPDGSDDLEVSGVAGGGVGTTVTLGSGAQVVVNADGSYSYDPNGQYDGLDAGETATDSFTYTIEDGGGLTDSATVTVTITGESNKDDVNGTSSGDMLIGDADPENIYGFGGADTIRGNGGDDCLFGGDGNDNMRGGNGDDVLVGGVGRDVLAGQAGADTFDYDAIEESTAAGSGRDRIVDFENDVDLIDLSDIDAISGGGDDAFTFVTGFSGTAGELQIRAVGAGQLVEGDVDGDGNADFAIYVLSDAPLDGGDFNL